MAMKMTTEAEKARKQKLVLVVLGVALLGVGAIQIPKLVGGSDSSETATPAPSASSTTVSGTTSSTGGTASPVPVATAAPVGARTPLSGVSAKVPLASVGGVQIQSGLVVVPVAGQLASLSLFEPKDPFTQQVTQRMGAGAVGTAGGNAPVQAAAPPAAVSSSVASDSGAGASGTPAQTVPAASSGVQAQPGTGAPLYATVSVNGSPVEVKLGAAFPQPAQTFVLTGLTPISATIRVKSGSFTKGKQVTMVFERGVLLTDAKTGDRIALKLLYTGSAPQQMASFKASAEKK